MTPQETFTPPDSPPAPRGGLDAAKRLFASLLTSRKVITALVGLIVLGLARRGIILEPDMVTEILTIFAVLIGAQGLADTGKEKAKVEAQGQPQGLFGLSKKDALKIGVGLAPGLLPGKAGEVAREITGQGEAAEIKALLERHGNLIYRVEQRVERVEKLMQMK